MKFHMANVPLPVQYIAVCCVGTYTHRNYKERHCSAQWTSTGSWGGEREREEREGGGEGKREEWRKGRKGGREEAGSYYSG